MDSPTEKFLQPLYESEAEDRRQKRIARLLKQSRLPDGKNWVVWIRHCCLFRSFLGRSEGNKSVLLALHILGQSGVAGTLRRFDRTDMLI